MRKMYSSAPLPFVGQKRMFAKEFIKVLGQFPDSTVFVDLFGGYMEPRDVHALWQKHW